MVLFKTGLTNLTNVLSHCKHAFHHEVKCSKGEMILIQQTYNSLRSHEKSIRWVMDYVRTYFDSTGESDQIWGNHWNYIIEGKNLRSVEPFDMDDLQVSDKNYKSAVTHVWIESSDEVAILDWIEENGIAEVEKSDLVANLNKEERVNIDEYIDYLNDRYSGTPNYKATVTYQIHRPTPLRNAIIERDGTKCRICNSEGFEKKNGLRYCEVHHMIELNKLAPKSLQSWNVIVVCPTCHKELHHGKVRTEFLDPGWRITIGNRTYVLIEKFMS
jgi:5-methylcytosine-specific restriction enzyme A